LEYKILYTKAALTGLDEIVEFIHRDDPAAAERFGNALLNHVDLLASFPRIGQPIARRPRLQKILHTPIWIYYRIHEDKKVIEVIRFWHGSRRPPKLR
jgi:plasmid stabilization system protein ParE